jgi:hypothetical protein
VPAAGTRTTLDSIPQHTDLAPGWSRVSRRPSEGTERNPNQRRTNSSFRSDDALQLFVWAQLDDRKALFEAIERANPLVKLTPRIGTFKSP